MTPESIQQKAEELYPINDNPNTVFNSDTLPYELYVIKRKSERAAWLAGCAFRSDEAVRFGEWIRLSDIKQLGDYWFWSEAPRGLTTAQLHEQFKKEDHG